MRSLAFVALLALGACAPDLSEGRPAAVVQEPSAAPPAAPAASTGSLAFDPARSRVHVLGAKITKTHPIVFPQFSGSVAMNGAEVTGFDLTVQTASVESDVAKLTAHLKTEDFLAVDQYPTATFRTTALVPDTSVAGSTHRITGDLTIRGVTKQVSFPASIEVLPTEVKGHAEFTINRKDFNIVYPGKPDDLIQDNVVMTIDLLAMKPG